MSYFAREGPGELADDDAAENLEPNMENYLMNMSSISSFSKGKDTPIRKPVLLDAQPTSKPVVETVEKEISPGVMQYNTKITEEDPCSGKKAVMHVSQILNKTAGTIITVQRTDYTGGCPVKDKHLRYGENSGILKRQ